MICLVFGGRLSQIIAPLNTVDTAQSSHFIVINKIGLKLNDQLKCVLTFITSSRYKRYGGNAENSDLKINAAIQPNVKYHK